MLKSRFVAGPAGRGAVALATAASNTSPHTGRVPRAVSAANLGNDIDRAVHWLLRGDQAKSALRLASQDQLGLQATTYMALFDKLARMKLRTDLHQAHKLLLEKGGAAVTGDVLESLVDAYARVGDIIKARKTVHVDMDEKKVVPSLRAYNSLIAGYARVGDTNAAIAVVSELRKKGLTPDDRTFWGILTSTVYNRDSERASKVWALMVQEQVKPSAWTYTAMLEACVGASDFDRATQTWSQAESDASLAANVTLFNAGILASTRERNLKEAVRRRDLMLKKNLKPNRDTFHAFLEYAADSGEVKKALSVCEEMSSEKVSKSGRTFALLSRAFARASDVGGLIGNWESYQRAALPLDKSTMDSLVIDFVSVGALAHADAARSIMVSNSLVPSTVTYEIVMEGHASVGNFRAVFKAFDEIRSLRSKVPSLTTTTSMYNSMLKAQAIAANFSRVKATMLHMYNATVAPDAETYTQLFHICGLAGQPQAIDHYRADMERRVLALNSRVCAALVTAYARTSSFGAALSVLGDMITGTVGVEPAAAAVRSLLVCLERDDLLAGSPAALELKTTMLDGVGSEGTYDRGLTLSERKALMSLITTFNLSELEGERKRRLAAAAV